MIKINGTEKQVAWATDIIDGALKTINANKSRVEKEWPVGSAREKELALWTEVENQYMHAIAQIDGKVNNAALIIEKRQALDSKAILYVYEKLSLIKK